MKASKELHLWNNEYDEHELCLHREQPTVSHVLLPAVCNFSTMRFYVAAVYTCVCSVLPSPLLCITWSLVGIKAYL